MLFREFLSTSFICNIFTKLNETSRNFGGKKPPNYCKMALHMTKLKSWSIKVDKMQIRVLKMYALYDNDITVFDTLEQF